MAFNVLIVDDSSSMRSVIRKSIKLSGFHVERFFEAGDGREALNLMGREWVDIVLTDINMPNMDGWELIGEMRKDALLGSIPVVLVTSEGSLDKAPRAPMGSVAGYIRKPFHPENIRKTMSDILGEDGHAVEPDAGGDDLVDF